MHCNNRYFNAILQVINLADCNKIYDAKYRNEVNQ